MKTFKPLRQTSARNEVEDQAETSTDEFGLESDELVAERADQLHTAPESKSWTARVPVPVRAILVSTALVSLVVAIVCKFSVTTEDTYGKQPPSVLWEKSSQKTDANIVADAPAREEQASCPPGFTFSHSGYWSNPGKHIPWTNVQHCASSCGANCLAFSLWGGHDCYLYSTAGGVTTNDADSMACNKHNGPAPTRETSGVDTPGWNNGHGWSCAAYASNKWCANGAVVPGMQWTLGVKFKYPEKNCVVCGKTGGPSPPTSVGDTVGWNNKHGWGCVAYAQKNWCAHGAFTAGNAWTGGTRFNNPELNCVVCGKTGGPSPPTTPPTPTPGGDTVGWNNGQNLDCAGYASKKFCAHGTFTAGNAWTGGSRFRYPEKNCVVCGKGHAGGGGTPPPTSPPTSPPSPPPSPPAGGVWAADGSPKHCRPNYGTGIQFRQRKDVESWTTVEWNAFSKHLNSLHIKGDILKLAEQHYKGQHENKGIHGTDDFLPWHRAFLEELETALQKEANDCSLTLPVYVWAKPGAATSHRTWRADRYGTLDFRAGPQCVTSGVASNWRAPTVPFAGGTECLKRNPNKQKWTKDKAGQFSRLNKFGVPYGMIPSVLAIFEAVRKKTDYTNMNQAVEGGHGWFHCWLGGTMCSHRSPADPIFWAHHAFIDQMWYDWQKYRTSKGEAHLANSCGSCSSTSNLKKLWRYDVSATDYVGQVDGNCIKYPATNPRICLSYHSPHTDHVRKLGEISPLSNPPVFSQPEQPSTCSTLIKQIMSGECSSEELKQIRVVDECRSPEAKNTRLGYAKEWEAVVLDHEQAQGPHLHNWTTVKKEITEEFDLQLEHPHSKASNDDELAACMKCDFLCSGR